MHTHVVYYATYKDIIVYIGSGTPERYKHCVSGVSHLYELNRLHFTEPDSVKVYILKGYTSQEDSLAEEVELIREFKPKLNTKSLEDTPERYARHKEDIEIYKEEFIPLIKQTHKDMEPLNKLLLNRKTNFITVSKMYEDAIRDNDKAVIELITSNPNYQLLTEFVSIFGIEKLTAVSYRKQNMFDFIAKHKVYTESSDLLKKSLKLNINMFYSAKDIKAKLTSIYEEMGINKKAKASDIETLYKTHKTVKSGVNGYIIVS